MHERGFHSLSFFLRPSFRDVLHTRLVRLTLLLSLVVTSVLSDASLHAAKLPEKKKSDKAGITMSVQGGVVQQRRQEDSVIQSTQQQIEIKQKNEEWRIPLIKIEEQDKKDHKADHKAVAVSPEIEFMGVAWQEFNRGNYQKSLDLFETLSVNPDVKWEAKYGMAMCHLKMKKNVKATQILVEVAAEKPYLKDTLPNLVSLLIEQGAFEQARSYAVRMHGPQKNSFLAKIEEGVFKFRVNNARQANDPVKYYEVVLDYKKELKQCVWQDTFYEVAGVLAASGDRDIAAQMYRSILSCSRNPDLRIGIYYSIKPLILPAEMLELLESKITATVAASSPTSIRLGYAIQLGALKDLKKAESITAALQKKGYDAFYVAQDAGTYSVKLGDFPTNEKALAVARKLVMDQQIKKFDISPPDEEVLASALLKPSQEELQIIVPVDTQQNAALENPEYLKKIRTLKLEALYNILQKSEAASVGELSEKIVKINPGDPVALSATAWWHFNNDNFEYAYSFFLKLHKSDPDNEDFAIGLIYCLMKLKEYDKAFELAKIYNNSEKITALAKEIRLTMLWQKVSAASSESADIETLAKEILELNPDDENVKLILAWWYFRNDKYEESYNEFKKLYDSKPSEKDHSYGLAISLEKLGRIDEAIEVAEKFKGEDERSALLLANMYLDKAKSEFSEKKYPDAEKYAVRSLANNPQDASARELLDLYRYKQTLLSRTMSKLEGLPGSSYGSLGQDLKGSAGFSISASLRQGVDWFKIPGDIVVNTYGEYKYSTRTNDKRYFDESGYGAGIELKKWIFNLGAEYFWDTYTQQNQSKVTELVYLSWFHDWTKRVWSGDDEGSWLKMDALSGSTYGKIFHDHTGLTGTGISGYINQGIDWFTIPSWNTTFNTYAEYRLSFRTADAMFYNSHGPAVGLELQRKPFTLGSNYNWQIYPERGLIDRQAGVYLRWYYDWDLKPLRDR